MAEPGFLYIVINPGMEGMVNLGRTSYDPADGVGELSCGANAAPPFIVAYKRFFPDSRKAERFVHSMLERRGYSPSGNREFFRARLEHVVAAVFDAPDGEAGRPEDSSADRVRTPSDESDEFLDSLAVEDSPIWESILEEAEAKYYGLGDELQDHQEALELYKEAARLGAATAYRMLGVMHRDGEGCVRSNSKALEYLKEAARRGDTLGYPEMAQLFADVGQMENARKCWSRYFANVPQENVGLYCYRYFNACRQHQWPISHIDHLRKYFADLQRTAQDFTSYARESYAKNSSAVLHSVFLNREKAEREIEELFSR